MSRLRWAVASAGAVVLAAASLAAPTVCTWNDAAMAAAESSAGFWKQATPPGPFQPADGVTTVGAPSWTLPATNTAGFCATLTVQTVSPDGNWQVLVTLADAPFWGTSADRLWLDGGAGTIAPDPDDPTRATMGGVAPTGGPVDVRVCTGDARTPPVADPDWYHVAATAVGVWDRNRACVRTTVTGAVDETIYPYFFGWTTTIDLAAAGAAVRSFGGTPTHVTWTPDSGGGYAFHARPLGSDPADPVEVTSGQAAAIRGTGTYEITACINAY